MPSIIFRICFVLSICVASLQAPAKNLSALSASHRQTYFSKENIDSNRFVEVKSQEWSACHQKKNSRYLLEAGANEHVSAFLDYKSPIENLEQMETENLMHGVAKKQPWSGDYWAISKGVLGNRFLDPNFLAVFTWRDKFKFIEDHSVPLILEKNGQDGISTFSPSEKYDLIIGDPSGGLTKAMWAEGQPYVDAAGKVESWMGICHGWAPAAIIEPRPTHAVDILSFDQKWSIHLVPAEIKGLASFSWATNSFDTAFLGQRCNKKNPKRDSHGRLTDPECFDLNPATWHLAIVNKLGKAGQSFVMDATYDYQVWNQPVLQYTYTYFNVQTKKPVSTLAEARVEKNNFNLDIYKKYRSREATTLVGVTMKVSYIVENDLGSEETDSQANDVIVTTEYSYDLELNSDGKIIGGEWYQIEHPDFIWTPMAQALPTAPLDHVILTDQWQPTVGASSIPTAWSQASIKSSKDGIILNTITHAIIEKANQ